MDLKAAIAAALADRDSAALAARAIVDAAIAGDMAAARVIQAYELADAPQRERSTRVAGIVVLPPGSRVAELGEAVRVEVATLGAARDTQG